MSLKDFISKLQNLPESKKKIIFFTIVGLAAVGLGFFWIEGVIGDIPRITDSLKSIHFSVNTPQASATAAPDTSLGGTVSPQNSN